MWQELGNNMIITIDGPVASGKSTIARLLAEKLGYYYIASGLLFRAYAYLIIQKKNNIQAIMNISDDELRALLHSLAIVYGYDKEDKEQVWYNDQLLNPLLTSPEIAQAASYIGTNKIVREHLVFVQRTIAQKQNVVAEGRDTGSIVFPQADYKFYVTASPEVRACRWQEFQQHKGIFISHEQALQEIMYRDDRDTKREIAPLIITADAQVIDGSMLDQQQLLMIIYSYIK